jgi:hypothetical protein
MRNEMKCDGMPTGCTNNRPIQLRADHFCARLLQVTNIKYQMSNIRRAQQVQRTAMTRSNVSGSQLPTHRPRSQGSSTALSGPGRRRASVSGLTSGSPKVQRTSKTSQKLVVLPSAPQTKPLHRDLEDETHGYETDAGVREYKSEAERMSKEQRQKAGFKRITAYCVAEAFKMKFLASFLHREHNVMPRVFDEALYVVSMRQHLIIIVKS